MRNWTRQFCRETLKYGTFVAKMLFRIESQKKENFAWRADPAVYLALNWTYFTFHLTANVVKWFPVKALTQIPTTSGNDFQTIVGIRLLRR